MNPEIEMLCRRLVGALATGAYQGILLTALVWLGLKTLPGMNAATRSAIHFITLLIVALLPVAHFVDSVGSGKPARAQAGAPLVAESDSLTTESNVVGEDIPSRMTKAADSALEPLKSAEELIPTLSLSAEIDLHPEPENASELLRSHSGSRSMMRAGSDAPPIPDSVGSFEPARSLDFAEPSVDTGAASSSREKQTAAVAPLSLFNESRFPSSFNSKDSVQPRSSDVTATGFASAAEPASPSTSANLPATMRRHHWEFALSGGLSVALVSGWFLLVLARLTALARQCWLLRSIKRSASAPISPDIDEAYTRLVRESDTTRRPRLVLSEMAAAPMALGFFHPAIVVPTSVLRTALPVQIESLLRHELAHIVRRDDWVNLIQQLIHSVLFFHPAVWWLSRRIGLDREIACDDHVLAAGRTARAYALFLTEFASRSRLRDLPAATAAWSSKNQLKERITMILDSKRNRSPRLARAKAAVLTASAAALAILGVQAAPKLAVAEPAPTANPPSEAQPSVPQPAQAPEGGEHHSNENVNASITTESNVNANSAISISSAGNIAVVRSNPGRVSVAVTPALAQITETGPKQKRGQPGTPAIPEPPTPPAATIPARVTAPNGVIALAPVAEPVAASVHALAPATSPAPVAGLAPVASPEEELPPTPAPTENRRRDRSFEERLDRLEQMLKSLMDREGGPKMKDRSGKPEMKLPPGAFQYHRSGEHRFELSREEMDRINEEARRAGEEAAREVERAMKELETTHREAMRSWTDQSNKWNVDQAGIGARRKALEQERKALEKQLAALERQIDRLEQQEDKLEQEQERLEEARQENEQRAPKAENKPGKPAAPKEKSKDDSVKF